LSFVTGIDLSDHILTLNAGSSSVKFALFANEVGWPRLVAAGQTQSLRSRPKFEARDARGDLLTSVEADEPLTQESAIQQIIGLIERSFPDAVIRAIGHRIVHGGLRFRAPVLIDDAVIAELAALSPLAPLHQPHNLAGVAAARSEFPGVAQVACFDTAFHRDHSFVNEAYGLPRRYYESGVRRFGFHGLSYEYVSRRMKEIAPSLATGRMIIAHLGGGASACALLDGRSVATSMGFSALDGLPMGTRCGQIDPGVLLYMLDHEKLSLPELTRLLYEDSGLLGLSGVSSDMRELEASRTPGAHEAIDYFTNRLRMEIGSLSAVLEGLDALAFTGGIGEHSFIIRADVVNGLGWLGMTLDERANYGNEQIISTTSAKTQVFVVPTNEEAMIADHTIEIAGLRVAPVP
jgi:acetate kinase